MHLLKLVCDRLNTEREKKGGCYRTHYVKLLHQSRATQCTYRAKHVVNTTAISNTGSTRVQRGGGKVWVLTQQISLEVWNIKSSTLLCVFCTMLIGPVQTQQCLFIFRVYASHCSIPPCSRLLLEGTTVFKCVHCVQYLECHNVIFFWSWPKWEISELQVFRAINLFWYLSVCECAVAEKQTSLSLKGCLFDQHVWSSTCHCLMPRLNALD